MPLWGGSSVGRALPWHGRGSEFDPRPLHHMKTTALVKEFLILALFLCCNKKITILMKREDDDSSYHILVGNNRLFQLTLIKIMAIICLD